MLTKKKCIPCQGGVNPLNPEEISILIKQLKTGWTVKENKRIEKETIK